MKKIWILLMIVLLIFTGCSSKKTENTGEKEDLQEELANEDKTPVKVNESDDTREEEEEIPEKPEVEDHPEKEVEVHQQDTEKPEVEDHPQEEEKVHQQETEKPKDHATGNTYRKNDPPDTPNLRFFEDAVDAESIENPYTLEVVDKTTLINKYNRLPLGWSPDNLVPIVTNHGSYDTYLQAEAAQEYEKMRLAAEEEGITLVVFSGYRSEEFQKELFWSYRNGDESAIKFSAYPRTSEHEAGLAVDISYDTGFPVDFYSTPHGIFLDENAHKYGFIMRYHDGKTPITGYMYESWHYRYVGTDLAKILKEKNITLEEYYGTN